MKRLLVGCAFTALIATGAGCRDARYTLGDGLDVTVRSYQGEGERTLYSLVARYGSPVERDAAPSRARVRACKRREARLVFAFHKHRPSGLTLRDLARESCSV